MKWSIFVTDVIVKQLLSSGSAVKKVHLRNLQFHTRPSESTVLEALFAF